jgi:hypothetical protein
MARPGRKKKTTQEAVNDIEQSVKEKEPKKERNLEFVSTGSWLLNLALTDMVNGGWPLGDMVNLIGDSDTAKSLIGLATMAEAVRDSRFDDHKLVYYAVETGLYFPMELMFGKNIKRVELKRKSPYTIQDWKTNIMNKSRKPIIAVLDSADALTTEEELKMSYGEKERKEGYINQLKPKVFSASLSPIVGQLHEHNSLLVVISQTRANIGVSFGPAKRRASGDALRFYSSCEPWLQKVTPITIKIRGEEIKIGEVIRAKVARTRITGKSREVTFQVYDKYGIDNVGSSIDWLVKWNFWGILKPEKKEGDEGEKPTKKEKKAAEIIDTGGDFENLIRQDLIKHIEDNNLEDKLKNILQESWNELEKELELDRKPRYT